MLGLLLGMGLAQLLRLALPSLPVHTPWSFALGALVMSGVIGLLAGENVGKRLVKVMDNA